MDTPISSSESITSTKSRWAGKPYPSQRPHKRNCDICGTYYEGKSPYTCSKSCQGKRSRGRQLAKQVPATGTPGRINHVGYVRLWMPHHPKATKGYILEHRWVMEQQIGRPLESWEMVHHRNGVRDDNRPENLEMVTKRVHLGTVACPHCGNSFSIR